MPIHDWTRVTAGLFHHFHQDWTIEIARSLNRGVLPKGCYALVEQRVEGPDPDVIAVETGPRGKSTPAGSTALLEPPAASVVKILPTDARRYARRANRVTVRHALGHVVALIEVVSPGNKDTRASLMSFVDKAVTFLHNGIHLVVIDLFPPTDRDPGGIHKAIWDEFAEEPFDFPEGKSRLSVGYEAGESLTAYIEPLAVGEPIPDPPLFIAPGEHVRVPLEASYRATWEVCPEPIRELIES